MGQDNDWSQSTQVYERHILFGKVTHLVDKGKAADMIYHDFSKVFDTLSHSTFPEELAAYVLTGWMLC